MTSLTLVISLGQRFARLLALSILYSCGVLFERITGSNQLDSRNYGRLVLRNDASMAGEMRRLQVLTEADWTDVEAAGVSTYTKSKTLAEKAAWDFVEQLTGLVLIFLPRYVTLRQQSVMACLDRITRFGFGGGWWRVVWT